MGAENARIENTNKSKINATFEGRTPQGRARKTCEDAFRNDEN